MIAHTRYVSVIATTYKRPQVYRNVRGFLAVLWVPLGGVNTVESVVLQLDRVASIPTPAAGATVQNVLTLTCGTFVPWDGSDIAICGDVASGAAGFVRLSILCDS
jgi:hypothetical protein